MLDDYRFKGPTRTITIELEEAVIETLNQMEAHSKIAKAQLLNTAVKRFISQHKDFLPTGAGPGPKLTGSPR